MKRINKLLVIVCAALLFIGAIYIIAPCVALAVDFGIKGILWVAFMYGSFRYCEYAIKCLYNDIYKDIEKDID